MNEEEIADLVCLRRARDLMDRDYAQPLDVPAMARTALMSPAHFSRQFRAAYGETPYAYLMTRRIERAQLLLRRGDLTVTGARRGRVATMLTHDGTTSRWRWSRARYCDGVSPTTSVKRELNEPSEVQPTATHVSVTDNPRRRSDFARSTRRVMRYVYGVSPYAARNLREKCAGDISAVRAMAGTSSGSA